MAARKKQMASEGSCGEAPREIRESFYGLRLDGEQKAFANAIWSPENDIVFVNAKSGTGKTTIAVGVASLLVHFGRYEELIYIMSPYGERKQGWLPGSITEKSSVYFEALYQALSECGENVNTVVNTDTMVNQKNGTGFVTCITDTFLRGTNLNNAVIIIDEAQNFTLPQLKRVLTRVGNHAKVIVIGHDLQCDLEHPESSGFIPCMRHFQGMARSVTCLLTHNYRGWISQWADEM